VIILTRQSGEHAGDGFFDDLDATVAANWVAALAEAKETAVTDFLVSGEEYARSGLSPLPLNLDRDKGL